MIIWKCKQKSMVYLQYKVWTNSNSKLRCQVNSIYGLEFSILQMSHECT